MARKIQLFEDCAFHGYGIDFENNCYDRDMLYCYSSDVKALRKFPVVTLCGHGGFAVVLDDKDYCSGCRFHAKDKERERQFDEPPILT